MDTNVYGFSREEYCWYFYKFVLIMTINTKSVNISMQFIIWTLVKIRVFIKTKCKQRSCYEMKLLFKVHLHLLPVFALEELKQSSAPFTKIKSFNNNSKFIFKLVSCCFVNCTKSSLKSFKNLYLKFTSRCRDFHSVTAQWY